MTKFNELQGIIEVEFDPVRDKYYFSTYGGRFVTWNNETGEIESSLRLGESLGGMDLSADGNFAYVARSDVTPIVNEGPWWDHRYRAFIEVVDLETTTRDPIKYVVSGQERGTFDLAIGSEGVGLLTTNFAGSGWNPFRQIDTDTDDTIIERTDPELGFSGIRQSSHLIESASGDHVLILESNISSAPMHIFDAETNTLISSTDNFSTPSVGSFNRGSGDISSVSEVLVNLTYGFRVYDFDFNVVADLRSYDVDSVKFSGDGSTLYGFDDDTDQLYAFDTGDWGLTATYALGDVFGSDLLYDAKIGNAHNDGELVLITDAGRAFGAAPSPGGFIVLDFDLIGTSGDDVFFGTSWADRFAAAGGDDILQGGAGDDFLDGSGGFDTVDYSGESGTWGVSVNLSLGEALDTFNDNDALVSIERIIGTARNDSFIGSAGADTFEGLAGRDSFDGKGGADTVTFEGLASAVDAYLNHSVARTDSGRETLISIENLDGTEFEDRLVGNAEDNILRGNDGNDFLHGKDGNDRLEGGAGNDVLKADAGTDTMMGGDGADTLMSGQDRDLLYGDAGDDFLYGGSGNDSLRGGEGNDALRGQLGKDYLKGEEGQDDLRGGANADTLLGGADNDTLFGEGGRDTLIGGAGNDSLTGGFGAGVLDGASDTFVYSDSASGNGGFDRIKDWEDGIDLIDLTSFGYFDFDRQVALKATDTSAGLRIDFGGGDVLFIEDFSAADFDVGDVILL